MQHTNSCVASLTQCPSDLPGLVAVIHYRSFLGHRGFVALGALSVLICKEAIILGRRQTISLLDPGLTRFSRVADSAVRGETVCGMNSPLKIRYDLTLLTLGAALRPRVGVGLSIIPVVGLTCVASSEVLRVPALYFVVVVATLAPRLQTVFIPLTGIELR